MDSEEYKFLCIRRDNLTKRLNDEQNESEINKFKAILSKIEEDICKIQNQRNSESKVQKIEQKINEIEPQINPNDLNYFKLREKFLESQLNDDNELNNTIGNYD
jgi:hypothetical protein